MGSFIQMYSHGWRAGKGGGGAEEGKPDNEEGLRQHGPLDSLPGVSPVRRARLPAL